MASEQSTLYDYLIIGAGAAGLQLCLAILEDPFFRNKRVAIIEKEHSNYPAKTWCYWETGAGKWDKIIDHSWNQGLFISPQTEIHLDLNPYRYKKLDAKVFREFANSKIGASDQIDWIHDEIKTTVSNKTINIIGQRNKYRATQIFDSRVDPAFNENHSCKKVWQHFKGWEIESQQAIFDPEVFTMMDFRIKFKDSTTFTYMLPTSPTTALIEFTFFTPFKVEDHEYDPYLTEYIENILRIKDYKKNKVERGLIPMSDYPFHKHHRKNITKIGTAGGWVRPSSGYSFRNTQRYIEQLIGNVKNNRPPHKGIGQNRFRTYDTIFLDLLEKHNQMGEELFTSMYSKNNIQSIFKFLAEQTSWIEDVRIISTFEKWPFLKAAARQI